MVNDVVNIMVIYINWELNTWELVVADLQIAQSGHLFRERIP